MTTLSYSPEYGDLLAVPADVARRLASVTRQRLGYWDLTDLVKPSIRRRLSLARWVRLYTFKDLVALIVTAQLRSRGVSLQNVRKVVAYLRRAYNYEDPLYELTFAVHNGEIYIRHPDGSWEGDRDPGQLVIRSVIPLDEIRNFIVSNVGRPLAFAGKVDRRKGKLGNKPTFMGTRIPVETVVRWLEHGATDNDIMKAYPDLQIADVETARRELASAVRA